VILSLLYVAVFFRPRKSPETSKQIVLGLGVAAVVAIALASPLLLALRAAHANYQTYVAEQYDSKYADVLGFLFPPESSLLWRWVGWTEPKEKLSQEGVTFLGYMASVIGLIALFSRAPDRRFTFWKIVFAVFLVLSLGAYLTVGREMDLFEFKDASSHRAFRLTLPYAFLSYIPLINNARGAVRFHAITSLAFAVLVAFGFSVITARGRWAQRRVAGAGLIAAFTLAEYAAVPIQTFRPQLEAFYAVRNDPDDVSVLDGLLNAREPLLHQVGHRKRNIVGHASRIPPEITGYVTGTPLLREFAGQALATPANVAAFRKRSDAPTIVADIADLLDLRYFVIDGEKDRFKRGLFDDYVPYRLVSAKDAIEVYRIEAPPRTGLRPGRIAVGEGAWSAYLGHGWGQWIRFTEPLEDRSAVWPVSPRETVFFKAGRSCDVAFDCDVYCPPGYDGVQVSVRIRGNEIARQTVPPGFSTVAAQVPATEVRAGLNEIEICWPPGSGTPVWDKCAEALPRLYFISGRLENEVRCAVLNIEGQRNWIVGRGYWLIQLSDDGRRTRDAKLFDPYADAAAWRNLVAYVDAIPEGRLVAFLAAFEASKDLPEEAVAALGRLGSAFDMRGKKGWGHAGLGIKGMQPGQAIEHAGSTPIGFAPGKCAFTEFRFREASQ
jgi:hypothetical protein